jgi:hypothetical protein
VAWGPNEAPPEALEVLGQAMAQLRFAPARAGGRPVPAELRLRLCFGDDGLLEPGGPGCWDPALR